jgi:hypothetical protein
MGTRVSLPSPGVKWLEHKANHLSSSCSKVNSGAILPLSVNAIMPCRETSSHIHWCHNTNITCQDIFHSLLSWSHMVQLSYRHADRQSRTSLCIMEADGLLTCPQKPLLHPTPMARQPYWASPSTSMRFQDHICMQHSQQTDNHDPGGIWTCNPTKRAAADPHLTPCSHWNRFFLPPTAT